MKTTKVYLLGNNIDSKEIFKHVNVSKSGIKIMEDKTEIKMFFIRDIRTPAANILKQDALSIGADLAVSKDAILGKTKYVDGVLIVNKSQLRKLIKKESIQDFGLNQLALKLNDFIKIDSIEHKIKIMGIINITKDSFYSKSRFNKKNAMDGIVKMISNKADIIDIGAVSTRPFSKGLSKKQEFKKIKPIIDSIYRMQLYKEVTFSIDSYRSDVVDYALNRGFHIANNAIDKNYEKIIEVVKKYNSTLIISHIKGTPKNMQVNPSYKDIILDVSGFFEKKVKRAQENGVKNIILDVGIGFGKTLEHNLLLIKHIKNFRKFGYRIMVGASRKSIVDKIVTSSPEDRLPGTLAIHLEAIQNGASIIRCHDVKEHYQAIEVKKSLQRIKL